MISGTGLTCALPSGSSSHTTSTDPRQIESLGVSPKLSIRSAAADFGSHLTRGALASEPPGRTAFGAEPEKMAPGSSNPPKDP